MESKTARDPKFAERVEKNREYLNSIRLSGKKNYEVIDINGNPGKAALGAKFASDGVDWKAIGKAAIR